MLSLLFCLGGMGRGPGLGHRALGGLYHDAEAGVAALNGLVHLVAILLLLLIIIIIMMKIVIIITKHNFNHSRYIHTHSFIAI